jgi:hypothetical protein
MIVGRRALAGQAEQAVLTARRWCHAPMQILRSRDDGGCGRSVDLRSQTRPARSRASGHDRDGYRLAALGDNSAMVSILAPLARRPGIV